MKSVHRHIYKPEIHHVLIILVPQSKVHKQLYFDINPKFGNGVSQVIQSDFIKFRHELEVFKGEKDILKSEIKKIMSTQFLTVQNTYFKLD